MNEEQRRGGKIKQLEIDIDNFMYYYDSAIEPEGYKLDLERQEITITYKAGRYLNAFILEAIEEDGGPANAKYEIEHITTNGLIVIEYEVEEGAGNE